MIFYRKSSHIISDLIEEGTYQDYCCSQCRTPNGFSNNIDYQNKERNHEAHSEGEEKHSAICFKHNIFEYTNFRWHSPIPIREERRPPEIKPEQTGCQ